jgi:hypothetical protein
LLSNRLIAVLPSGFIVQKPNALWYAALSDRTRGKRGAAFAMNACDKELMAAAVQSLAEEPGFLLRSNLGCSWGDTRVALTEEPEFLFERYPGSSCRVTRVSPAEALCFQHERG